MTSTSPPAHSKSSSQSHASGGCFARVKAPQIAFPHNRCEQRYQPYVVMGAAQSDHANLSKAELVMKIKTRLATVDPTKAKEVGGVFLFNIIKGTSVYSWTLDLNRVMVYEGEPEEDPDTTFTLNEHYFKQLVSGREDARVIMQAGRCSVTGDIMRAMKLEPYIKLD